MGCLGCVGSWGSSRKNEADLPWVQALANPECLDWRRGSGSPLSQEEQRRIQTEQAALPVQIHEFLYLGDAKTATRVGRIKYIGITHVLNLAGTEGAPKKSTFVEAGMLYQEIAIKDREGYPILSKHLLEARNFIAKARNSGGKCLVYCMTGLNASAAIVAAELMLSQKRAVLEVVREGRKMRGNAFLSNLSFQQQLVALARKEGLLGAGLPGSPAPSRNDPIIARAKPSATDSLSMRRMHNEEDGIYLEVMRDPEYLDWRQRADPDTGRVPDEDEQLRIEKEQGNLPVQISANVFLADARSSKKVARLKWMGITHVLNVAGPEGAPSSHDTYNLAKIEYKMIDCSSENNGHSILNRHLEDARSFIGAAAAAGGKCLVYCMTGYEVSGVIVAADKMLSERMSMLEVLAYCRRKRGNSFLTADSLLDQWLALSRREGLQGARPGTPGSIILSLAARKGGVTSMRRGLFSNSFSLPKAANTNPESRNQVAHGIAARHVAARQRDAQNQHQEESGTGRSRTPSFFNEQKQLSPIGHIGRRRLEDGPANEERNPSNSSSYDLSHEGVLYSLFPIHIADAMIRGEVPKEDRSECSTVVFADVVGFTDLSSRLESNQVADMLHRLFTSIDEAATTNGVYKLETIGDCYIAVANLVQDQSTDHVVRVANFCLDAMQMARETPINPSDPSMGTVKLRIGFDSGPVVGNVVGTCKKKYTVFGNTVNTASRMESMGEPGRIQCTKRSADLLRQQDPRGFKLIERGELTVKGKGKMVTYFLDERCGSSSQASATLVHLNTAGA